MCAPCALPPTANYISPFMRAARACLLTGTALVSAAGRNTFASILFDPERTAENGANEREEGFLIDPPRGQNSRRIQSAVNSRQTAEASRAVQVGLQRMFEDMRLGLSRTVEGQEDAELQKALLEVVDFTKKVAKVYGNEGSLNRGGKRHRMTNLQDLEAELENARHFVLPSKRGDALMLESSDVPPKQFTYADAAQQYSKIFI